jgi:hypothetical protein
MEASDAYQVLLNRLNYPDSTRLRTVLELFLTPQQAEISAVLPGTAETLAETTGIDVEVVRDELETLFQKGIAFPKGDYANREYFNFTRGVPQLHDNTQAYNGLDVVKDRKFFEAWHDFTNNEWNLKSGEAYASAPAPWERIIPAWSTIKDLPDALPCEDIREIFKAQDRIAVVPCSCRIRTTSVDEHCTHTAEEDTWHCFQFNRSADYSIARQGGVELTLEEALARVEQTEQDGLLHIGQNTKAFTGFNFA